MHPTTTSITQVQTQQASTSRTSKTHRPAILLTLAGLALRLIGLGSHSFWFDEAREILRASRPWPQVLFLSEGTDPPTFRLLIAPIAALTLSEFWLRLPAALFGAGAIYLAYRWLSEIGRPRLGLITAALLAFAPVEIYYSQEVSQYSMSVFLSLLLLITFERAARKGGWLDWLTLSLASLAAIYSYYGLAWLLPALDLDLAWRTWRQRSRKRLTGFAAFHAVLSAGTLLLYRTMLSIQHQRFIERKLTPRFARQGLLQSLCTLDNELFENFLRFFTLPWSSADANAIVVLLAGLAVLGGIVLWRRVPASHRSLLILLLTLIIMYAANGLGLYPFGLRYALLLSPFFFLLTAGAIWHPPTRADHWRPVAIVVGSLITLAFLAFSPNVRLIPNPWLALPREELRPVVQYLYREARPEDFIYVYYGAGPAYRVYRQAYGPEEPHPTAWGEWFRTWPTDQKVNSIREVVGDSRRFWLVMSHIYAGEDQELIRGLAQTTVAGSHRFLPGESVEPPYHVIDEFRAPNAAALLLRKD
jgi:4-amino-4-deoxy-L-arabinose transferase-like glycosyltransferase